MFRRGAVRQSAPGAWISGRCRDRARWDVHAGPAGAHARCRGDNAGAHCGVVYEFLHHRRVVVVPPRQDRNAVGLAQRFCSRRNSQYRRRRHRVGCTAAGGSRNRQGAAPRPRYQTGSRAQAWIMLAVGALISFFGVPAGLLGNELSIRYGLRNIATLVFLLSAFAGGLFGFTAMLPYIAVLSLAVVAGFIVQGNFSNLTSGVLAVADPRHRGATIGPRRVPRDTTVQNHA